MAEAGTQTYEERRTELEKRADAVIKERVQRGIELLKEKWGPDFADHIDMGALRLRDASACVLGQLYADWEPTVEQWAAAADAVEGRTDSECGYWRGIAIIDGPLLAPDGTVAHGFDTPEAPEWYVDDDEWGDSVYTFARLDDAWREALTELRS